MILPLIPLFLGFLVQNTCSPAEASGQAKRCDKKSFLTIWTECQACSTNFAAKCPDGYVKITNGSVGVRDCRYALGEDKCIHLRSEHTLCLSLDAAIYVGRTTYNLNVVQATGAHTAWNAQQEQHHRVVAEAFVMKAWKELDAAPVRRALVEQPVKPVLLTMFLGPIVHQCATVSMVCATAASMVTEPVSASLPTRAPGVTHVKELLMDNEAARYFVKLHIIGGQMSTEQMNDTDTFYTLTGKSGEIFNRDKGQILANDVAVQETGIVAKNGRIYTLAGVLVPPSIIPIIPHRCDETKKEMIPALFTHKCVYSSRTRNMKSGCARYCNATIKCRDGLSGNGTCICDDGFQGSKCQFCSNPNRYGPRCNKTCLCAHGACDNRVDSDGACLSGTCREGTAGKFCNKQTSTCGPYVYFCHIHATCKYYNGTASCVCNEGYEGDGTLCSKKDPCMGSTSRGGCSQNASCQFASSGVWSCVCQEGYEGNGLLCYGNVFMNASLQSMLSATLNFTVLVPSQQAIEDMDQNEKTFWLSWNNIPALIKYHTLLGTYGVSDLQTLSSSHRLATSLQGSFLHLDKANGNITIEGASIVDGDNAATNGVIHIINKFLIPT
ncbi:hypothetical protein NN561_008056 [Cricetulus griseus]